MLRKDEAVIVGNPVEPGLSVTCWMTWVGSTGSGVSVVDALLPVTSASSSLSSEDSSIKDVLSLDGSTCALLLLVLVVLLSVTGEASLGLCLTNPSGSSPDLDGVGP